MAVFTHEYCPAGRRDTRPVLYGRQNGILVENDDNETTFLPLRPKHLDAFFCDSKKIYIYFPMGCCMSVTHETAYTSRTTSRESRHCSIPVMSLEQLQFFARQRNVRREKGPRPGYIITHVCARRQHPAEYINLVRGKRGGIEFGQGSS